MGMRRIFACVLVLGAAAGLTFLARSFIIAQAAPTVTPVCDPLSSDTTWTALASPYEVCPGGVTVAQGVTLTIQSGVTVQFQSGARLTVSGRLAAAGTPAQPITFTGVTAAPGSWAGILGYSGAITPAQVSLDYVTLEYGGSNASTSAQLYADHADITVTHSLVRSGAGNGVYSEGDGDIAIHDTHFVNNGRDAVVMVTAEHGLSLGGLTASGNGRNVVYVPSTTYMHGQVHWPAPGLPYIINSVLGNATGDSLTIDPGNELQFTSTGWLNIAGEFKAIGLPEAPITLTAVDKTPGAWIGLVVYGGQTPANAQLDHVTVEYGGHNLNGANISVTGGYLVARNSTIRYSQYDGVQFNSHGAGTVLNSQIVGNPTYGVRNTHPTFSVLAANDWWGDASGPASDLTACSQGSGDRVTAGVLFRPVLTDTDTTAPFPLSDAPILTLTPRRWFAPADGTTKIYFDIFLKDGNGAPLPGRVVKLSTSLGTPTDGGITDVNGHTLAYLVSSSVGDSEVTAGLGDSTACEGAMSPTAKVTFTTPIDITDLFPDSPASYFDGNINVSPLPVIVGVTSTIQVKLTNPLTLPITVDVSFGFAQSGIGLAFGPIKEITGQVIPANSSVTLSASWLPVLSGHYCVQVSYNITAIGGVSGLRPQKGGGSGLKQFNLNSQPGPMGPPNSKDILNKADKSWNTVSKFSPRGVKVQKGILDLWWGWAKDSAKKISQALGFDPPRQDFNQTTLPVWHTWPAVQPDANISAARAAALNAASSALADVNAYGAAAALALDRYAGASEAQDLTWAAQQANARLYYQQQMGAALLTYADNLEAFVQVLIDEGETDVVISVNDVISYQQDLAAHGFTPQEVANARLLGLTDADIEAYRQEILDELPKELSGNMLDFYTNEAAISRDLGNALLHPYSYAPGLSISGGAGLMATTASGNSLAQINNAVVMMQVSNPLTQTAVIDLQVRRIDLPADWMVSVTPAQVSLAPGEVTTVTVTVLTGSLVPQDAIPRVSVEGYVGDQLIGGVAIEIVVPRYMLFDGKVHIYLPLLER